MNFILGLWWPLLEVSGVLLYLLFGFMLLLLFGFVLRLRLLAETNEFRHAEMLKIAENRFWQATKIAEMPKPAKNAKNAKLFWHFGRILALFRNIFYLYSIAKCYFFIKLTKKKCFTTFFVNIALWNTFFNELTKKKCSAMFFVNKTLRNDAEILPKCWNSFGIFGRFWHFGNFDTM